MAKNPGIRVLGISQAVANLRTMADALQVRVTRKAVRAATTVILKQIKATTYNAPRDRRTGLLGRSLGLTISTRKAGWVVGKIIMRPVDVTGKSRVAQHVRRLKKAKLGNATEMAAYYWRFLEKGTKKRSTKGGANRGSVPAMPWVVPAFDAKSTEALDVFSKVFNRETEAEAKKLNTRSPTT